MIEPEPIDSELPTAVYCDPLEHYFCAYGESEKVLRRRIYVARDRATRRALRSESCDQVKQYCWDAVDYASQWLFAPATIPQLRLVILHLAALAHCANTFESAEHGDV